MALEKRTRHTGWRFVRRFLLLTGLLVAVGALVYWRATNDENALFAAIGAGGAAGLMLLLEVLFGLGPVLSRRGAVGGNVAVQTLLALALVIGGNVYAFQHHHRWDLTREQMFTLDESLQHELKQLRGQTTIVVHLRHVTSSHLRDYKPDEYDAAAEKKVQEKVRDLVEQFQELGPRFQVVALDVQEKGYQDRLKTLTKDNPPLRDAIDRSVENSVFFASDNRVQRLSFSQVFQLDKLASKEANGGRGNLVLRPQGVEPFARRILNIDEKKPSVAVAVIHPYLGLNSDSPGLNLSGLKKALASQGMRDFDLILKKPPPLGSWEPLAVTFDESKYDQLEAQLSQLELQVEAFETELKQVRKARELLAKPLEQLNQEFAVAESRTSFELIDLREQEQYRAVGFRVGPVQTQHRDALLSQIGEELEELEDIINLRKKRRVEVEQEKRKLPVDDIAELRRVADVRAKLKRLLADADLLVVPRFTFMNLAADRYVPYWLHGLDRNQTEAIKEFLKAGKPVLFLLGPGNTPAGEDRPETIAADELDPVLKDLGFRLPEQAVLHNVETEVQPERRGIFLVLPPPPQVPPLAFDWTPGAGLPRTVKVTGSEEPHPLRRSLRLTLHGLEKEADVRVRYPRPVYYAPEGVLANTSAVFLMSSADTWNESQPFPDGDRMPVFEPSKAKGKDGDPLLEERRGPFPVGIAVGVEVPASWYPDDSAPTPLPRPRGAVVGAGDLFAGETLSPAREKLFFDTANWLLGRDDYLAHETDPWQYPRVELSEADEQLWLWGARLGLPMLFVYLGLVMWMIRRMR